MSRSSEFDMILLRLTSYLIFIPIFSQQDALYVTNVYDGNIYVLNKTTGKELENPISITSHRAYGIAVYGEENQPLKETGTGIYSLFWCYLM